MHSRCYCFTSGINILGDFSFGSFWQLCSNVNCGCMVTRCNSYEKWIRCKYRLIQMERAFDVVGSVMLVFFSAALAKPDLLSSDFYSASSSSFVVRLLFCCYWFSSLVFRYCQSIDFVFCWLKIKCKDKVLCRVHVIHYSSHTLLLLFIYALLFVKFHDLSCCVCVCVD